MAALLRERRHGEALAATRAALDAGHRSADLLTLHARAQQASGLLDGFHATALELQRQHPGALASLLLAEAQVHTGGTANSAALARQVAADAPAGAAATSLLLRVAELLTHAGSHADAVAVLRDAVARAPEDRNARFNLLAALVTLGELDEAADGLADYLAAHPDDWDAWHLQAGLRTWSADHHHLDTLRRMLAGPLPKGAAIPLGYALGKECEDLGEHANAWQAIHAAAGLRRRQLGYRVQHDTTLLARLQATFDHTWWQGLPAGASAPPGQAPLFVCGLPRTGTTLVDRVLAAHSSVTSLGEVNDVAHSLLRCTAPDEALVAAQTGPVDAAARQLALVDRAAALAPDELGRVLQASLAGHAAATPRVSDKTPMNSLYLGLLAAALPDAALVLVMRHPLDAAWAMYKTLFRMGYPFSYALDDLAAWLSAWHGLVAHWQTLLGERLTVLRYEDLVSDQDATTRRLLGACGLPFEAACLAPHRAAGAVATASATQVRAPVHNRSVGRWQVHADALAPLAARLDAAGIPL